MPISNDYILNQGGKTFTLSTDEIPSKSTGGKISSEAYSISGESIVLGNPVINAVDIDWNGVQVRGTEINTTGELLTVIENMSTSTGGTGIQGKQGPAGTQGTRGLQGPAGSGSGSGTQGTQGRQGNTGATGMTGATGTQGARGLQGPAGSGSGTGTQGPQGPAGVQGPAGSGSGSGTQGAQGAKGATGAQGPAGSGSGSGTQGPAGATGVQGRQGTQGPAGSGSGSGTQGAQGATGMTGATGAQGKQGAAGSGGLSGSGTVDHVTYWTSSTALGSVSNVTVSGGYLYESSDERIKSNIKSLSKEVYAKVLENVLTKEYDLQDGSHKVGFIAQELLNTIPSAVYYNADSDLYSVHYTEALAAYCGALHTKVLELEKRLAALEK